MSVTPLVLDGSPLTLADAERVATEPGLQVTVPETTMDRVRAARAVIEDLVARGEPVYGVNTGFGKLQNTAVGAADRRRLQRNLVLSHAVGVGDAFPAAETRLMFVLRLAVMLRGHSGVRPELVERLVSIFNAGLVPVVPQRGSVGASGDLAPLAHLALVFIGDGEVWTDDGGKEPAADALRRAGLPVAFELAEKEGLALLNGTQAMTAVGLFALAEAETCLKHADLATAATLDALLYTSSPFQARVHALRPHPGQAITAENVRRLLSGSEILQSHPGPHKVQDAYSVRCVPQVHGACRDALAYVRGVLLRETESVTDNPLVFPDDGDVVSAGHFHGEPVALACDHMAIAAAEIGSISERRIESLVNPDLSQLPAFLTPRPGVNSGFMMAQVTAAALVSENKALSHPASVDSIPTSANQEDHVSMGPIAARKARAIVMNIRRVLGIELLCAAQAIEFRRPLRAGDGVEAALAVLREHVPPLEEDRLLAHDLEAVDRLIRSGAMIAATEAVTGPLHGISAAV